MSFSVDTSKQIQERVLLVGIYGPETPRIIAKEYLDELELLTDTAGGKTVEKVLQNRTKPDIASYVGKGKLNELKRMIHDLEIDTLIFDDDLTATQMRNIEKTVQAKVLDRSALILDIFASRAQTAAAKTQVELAQLQYTLPRLTRYWTHLSRQKGGIGTKGPGETQIETDRRMIGKRIAILKEKLEKLNKQRATQRKGREKLPRISLVGYTNAGKSTLMNALTNSNQLAENRLFATLDSTVRRLELLGHNVLLSDTVGFIRKLPHHLIESFKTTLDEVRESNVLLHVVDGSSPNFQDFIEVVESTLLGLNIIDKPTLLALNKVDGMSEEQLAECKRLYPDAIFISASQQIGLYTLQSKIKDLIELDYRDYELKIPANNYKAISKIHKNGKVESEQFEEGLVLIKFQMRDKDFKQLCNLLDNIETPHSVL